MVTLVPGSTLIMEAYSMPMTPAPTTMKERGTRSMPPHRSWSESNTRFPSYTAPSERTGRVPHAIITLSAVSTVLGREASLRGADGLRRRQGKSIGRVYHGVACMHERELWAHRCL